MPGSRGRPGTRSETPFAGTRKLVLPCVDRLVDMADPQEVLAQRVPPVDQPCQQAYLHRAELVSAFRRTESHSASLASLGSLASFGWLSGRRRKCRPEPSRSLIFSVIWRCSRSAASRQADVTPRARLAPWAITTVPARPSRTAPP